MRGTEPYDILWEDESIEETISVLEPDTLGVLVTDSNDCPISSIYFILDSTSTGLDDLADFEYSLYPNPARDKAIVRFDASYNHVMIKMTDIRGSIIRMEDFQNIDQIIIERNGLSSGLYFIEIEVDRISNLYGRLIFE